MSFNPCSFKVNDKGIRVYYLTAPPIDDIEGNQENRISNVHDSNFSRPEKLKGYIMIIVVRSSIMGYRFGKSNRLCIAIAHEFSSTPAFVGNRKYETTIYYT